MKKIPYNQIYAHQVVKEKYGGNVLNVAKSGKPLLIADISEIKDAQNAERKTLTKSISKIIREKWPIN